MVRFFFHNVCTITKFILYKRFEGHQVGGFSIDMDVSKDGEFLCSGSSGGKLYFYDWKVSLTYY